MTELGTLENKRLSDLHQIASQLGIPKYRTYRKPELAQRIYQVATEQADGQSAQEETASAVAEAAPATETIPEPAPAEPSTDGGETPAEEKTEQGRHDQQGKQKPRQQEGGQQQQKQNRVV